MEFSVTFFSAECIILLLYTWKYKIYFIKDIWICLWKYKVLFVCGHLVTRFITRKSDPSFPGGARQHVETEGRIRECIHTVSLVQTTTKSQNSEPANCTEETGDWTLMHSTACSFNHISVSLGNIWGFYFWSMLLPHESAETCNKY